MTYKIRQAIAAYVLAFFLNLALATSSGKSVEEIAMMWARRPAIILAYDPDDLSGELTPDDDEGDDLGWLNDEPAWPDDAHPPYSLSDDDELALPGLTTAADLPPDPALDPGGYTAWFTAKLPPKQALMWRLMPDTQELPPDMEALRWRRN